MKQARHLQRQILHDLTDMWNLKLLSSWKQCRMMNTSVWRMGGNAKMLGKGEKLMKRKNNPSYHINRCQINIQTF
jgi:hypothetical protein